MAANRTAGGLTPASLVRDAVFSGLLALVLLGPIVGLRTEQNLSNELVLATRWDLLLSLVAATVIGRILIRLFVAWRDARSYKAPARTADDGHVAEIAGRVYGPALLVIALGLPIAAIAMAGLTGARYWVDLGTLILTYVMLGWGLNIVVGLAGLLDLGYVAFYAVGAYSYALLAKNFGFSFWLCLPLAGILAAFWGIILGFPVLRLRGDYLAIVTLAFGEIIRLVLINWQDFTGGTAGIYSIPRETFFGIPFARGEHGFAALFGMSFDPMQRVIFLYYLILVLALITNFVTIRLRRLPIGRAWEALREDEIACRSLGINTTLTKLTAFATGAAFGGFAGAFFATRQGFISPESFNFMESAIILAIVVLGGMGSQLGVATAAVALTAVPELLRNLGFLRHIFGEDFEPTQFRMFLVGLAMVLIMIWRPRGFVGARQPTVFLKERKAVSGALVGEGHG